MSIEKLFIYSDSQIQSFKEINKKVGRDFKCGTISIGSKKEQYSAIISKDKLKDTLSRYPDLKIVYEGDISKVKYTKISNEFLKG